jgi:hypothetical protein
MKILAASLPVRQPLQTLVPTGGYTALFFTEFLGYQCSRSFNRSKAHAAKPDTDLRTFGM